MKISFDKDADALCIELKEGRISKDHEISPNVFAGFSRDGELIELQILEISEKHKPWITVEAASKLIHKSNRTIIRWIHDGKLKSKKVGREYRIEPEELKKII